MKQSTSSIKQRKLSTKQRTHSIKQRKLSIKQPTPRVKLPPRLFPPTFFLREQISFVFFLCVGGGLRKFFRSTGFMRIFC